MTEYESKALRVQLASTETALINLQYQVEQLERTMGQLIGALVETIAKPAAKVAEKPCEECGEEIAPGTVHRPGCRGSRK